MSSRRPLARAVGAEAIGTFALVFAGAGAVMVEAKTAALGHVGVAITFGLVIAAMAYAVGDRSQSGNCFRRQSRFRRFPNATGCDRCAQ